MSDRQEFERARNHDREPSEPDAETDALVLNEVDTRAYFNDEDGTLAPSDQPLGSMPVATTGEVALADLDGDDGLDLVLARQIHPTQIWLNDGDGRFELIQELPNSIAVSVADVDDDGHPDLLSAIVDTTTVLLGDGSGQFSDTGQNLGQVGNFGDAALADVNDDGHPDAILGNEAGPSTILFNDGTGLFSDSGQRLPNGVLSVAVADFNGDETPDLYFGRNGDDRLFLNDGSGNFSDTGQSLFGGRSWDVAVGDVNADGHPDVVVGSGDPGPVVELNDGNGNFTVGQVFDVGLTPIVGVDLADLNDDGTLDAALANFDGPDQVWFNDGDGTFIDSGQVFGDGRSLDIALGELDDDGDDGDDGEKHQSWNCDRDDRYIKSPDDADMPSSDWMMV